MSNEDNKTYPTHRISFSEKRVDEQGREKLGAPVEVATVWPRKGDKQGGIIQWNISPEKLDDGVYFMLNNERLHNRDQNKDAFDQSGSRGSDRGSERSR